MERAKVYFTRKITPEGLVNVYKNLGIELDGKVAIKMAIGERGSKGYLKPELIAQLVKSLNGVIVECNAFHGALAKSPDHYKVAQEHGFTSFAQVDILDAEGELKVPVNNGKHLKYNAIGSHTDNYSSYLCLAHAKGNDKSGFSATLNNLALGFASRNGKAYIHSAGKTANPAMLMFKKPDQKDYIECIAEAAKAVSDHIKEHEKDILYITVMNYNYLCCTDEEILTTHVPDGTVTLPSCTDSSYNYYRINGMYYETWDYSTVYNALMESVQRGDASIVMKFGTRDAYETAKFELFTNRMYYDADQYLMTAYGVSTWNNKYATDDDFQVITIQWL